VARNRKDQNGRPGLNGASYNGTVLFNSSNTNTTGDPFADALLGNYQQYTETSSDPIGHFRFTDVEAYVADTWKVARHLSLEFGVRYQRPGPTYTQGNTLPASTQPFMIPPKPLPSQARTPSTRRRVAIASMDWCARVAASLPIS